MKNQNAQFCIRRVLPFILLFLSSMITRSQTYDIYVSNRVITSDTTMEFDVFIKSNDTTGFWALRTYQAGYQFNGSFVNGGSLRGQYIIGSTDLTEGTFGKTWSFTWNNANKVLNQSANTGGTCPGALIGPVARKIARFRVTNSVAWGCANDDLTITTASTQGSGFLKLAVTKWSDPACNITTTTTITNNATTYNTSLFETFLQATATAAPSVSCGRTTPVTVSATGGLPPYTGTGNFDRNAGSWSFTVSDARGCTVVTNVTIAATPDTIAPVIITCAPPQSVTANSATVPDFTVNVSATDNCLPQGTLTITQSPVAGTIYSPGIYPIAITVKDGSNNSATCQTTFTVLAPCNVTATVVATTGVVCFNGNDGTATVTLANAGANPSGTYSLDGGPAIAFNGTAFTINGISAGTHSITVIVGGCTAATGSFLISGPTTPLVSSFSGAGCGSYSLPWGQTVTSSGSYTHVYTSLFGCDSTVTANITINQGTFTSTTTTVCNNQLPYSWNGSSLTGSGIYTFDYINSSGCQSTDTLYLSVADANYWKGTISEAWENPLNWGCGQVPDATSTVIIQVPAPFFPIIRSQASCKKITVGPTATLRVATGFSLNVTGRD